MHQSAKFYGQQFFNVYCAENWIEDFTIVDIGSQDINGSLREVAPDSANYIGLDFAEGVGVDLVIDDPYCLPIPDSTVDMVVSSSCFEHAEFFWLSFLEIARVLKPGGFIYLNSPSNGKFHRYPVDCWRFYPDSGEALAAFARRSGCQISLCESFVGARSEEDNWNDFVAIFTKQIDTSKMPSRLVIDRVEGYTNGRTYRDKPGEFSNFCEHGHEAREIWSLRNKLYDRDHKIASLYDDIDKRDSQIKSLENLLKS